MKADAVWGETRKDIGGFKKSILRGKVIDLAGVHPTIPKAARRCPECAAQLMPPSDEVAEAMCQLGAPSGAQIADHAAKVLASRLTGEDGSSAR